VISCFCFIKLREVSFALACVVSAVQVLLFREVDAELHRYYLHNTNDVSRGREGAVKGGTRAEHAVVSGIVDKSIVSLDLTTSSFIPPTFPESAARPLPNTLAASLNCSE
jgi:hypothetical protein